MTKQDRQPATAMCQATTD